MNIMRFIAVNAAMLFAVSAPAAEYYIFPLMTVTGISESPGVAKPESAASEKPYGALIDGRYVKAIYDGQAQKNLAGKLSELLQAKYPNAVIGAKQVSTARDGVYRFEPNADCHPSFKANYRDTYAASIGISRLSVYVNSYQEFTQVLIPVTYTLRFTKLDGASTVFSKSSTVYTSYTGVSKDVFKSGGTEIADSVLAKLKVGVLKDGQDEVGALMDAAQKGFSPQDSAVNIIGREGDYFIFDRGSEIGFDSGTEAFGIDGKQNEYQFTIKYATQGVALAVAANYGAESVRRVNSLREGVPLTFSFAKQGKDDAKPTILAVQYDASTADPEKAALNNALMDLIVGDIGFKAPFNLVSVDPDSWRLKNQIAAEANCSGFEQQAKGFTAIAGSRVPPDFFLKLISNISPLAKAEGVGGIVQKSRFENLVALEVVDNANVVRQHVTGQSMYDLEQGAGKGLSVQQATEVNLKNAALLAIKDLAEKFSPKMQALKVKSVAPEFATLESAITPQSAKTGKFVRPIEVKRSGKTINVPLDPQDIEIKDLESVSSKVPYIGVAGALKAGDLFVASAESIAHPRLSLCPASRKRHALGEGLSAPADLTDIVESSIAASLKDFQFVDSNQDFLRSKALALQTGLYAGAEGALAKGVGVASENCISLMEIQQLQAVQCEKENCKGKATVGAAVRIYQSDVKAKESALPFDIGFQNVQRESLPGFVGFQSFEAILKSVANHVDGLNKGAK